MYLTCIWPVLCSDTVGWAGRATPRLVCTAASVYGSLTAIAESFSNTGLVDRTAGAVRGGGIAGHKLGVVLGTGCDAVREPTNRRIVRFRLAHCCLWTRSAREGSRSIALKVLIDVLCVFGRVY